jgi:hypothetical protein
LLLWVILLTVLLAASHLWVKRNPFTNANQEGNLLILPEGVGYDYLVLGISHGRNLSRRCHHALFESVFSASMINLSQGESLGGLENQALYLKYFLSRNNKARELILVLSPSLMFNQLTDQSDISFYREPLSWDFFNFVANNGGKNKKNQLFHYFKSKLGHHWWNLKPDERYSFDGVLPGIDVQAMKEGFQLAYPEKFNFLAFKNRMQVLHDLVNTAETAGMSVSFVIPPAVFGIWPGHGAVLAHLNRVYPGRKLLDHSQAITQNIYYYDHHHLNTEGIKKYLAILYSGLEHRQLTR